MNTPQTYVILQGFLVFLAGMAANQGWISHEWVQYLGGPETLAFIGALGGAAVVGVTWYKARTKAVVATAGHLLAGQGAIIAPPSIANSSVTPSNVVDSLAAAAKQPGVPS